MSGETQNSEGLKLYTKKWLPGGTPKAVVFIIHGAGEYCERYEEVALKFNEKGWAVFTHDHQGHGKSEGVRQHVNKFSDYADDALKYIRETFEANPTMVKLPRFIWGHSMGGKIAAQLMIRSEEEKLEMTGFVLTGPALKVDPAVDNVINRFLAKSLSYVAPKFAIPWEPGPVAKNTVAGDLARDKAYREDPLVYHGCLRVNWSWQFIKGIDWVTEKAAMAKHPVFCMHGSEDKICIPEGSETWIGRIGSTDKKFVKVEGAFHEIHNDVEAIRTKAVADMIAWMESHMTAPQPASACV